MDHESDSAVKRYVALSNCYFVDLAGCERVAETGGQHISVSSYRNEDSAIVFEIH